MLGRHKFLGAAVTTSVNTTFIFNCGAGSHGTSMEDKVVQEKSEQGLFVLYLASYDEEVAW